MSIDGNENTANGNKNGRRRHHKNNQFANKREPKKPRIVSIPEHRKLSEKGFLELQEHAQRSAMHYLSKSQKSEQTIRDKLLAKGYIDDTVLVVPDPELDIGESISEPALEAYLKNTDSEDEQNIIENVIAWLKEYDFIDDKTMALNIIRSERLKGKGDIFAKRKMMEKNISADIIESAFEDNADDDEDVFVSMETSAREALDTAARSYMLRSTYQNEDNEYKRKGKMYRFLSTRGFSSAEINDFFENGFLEEE